MHSLRQSPPEPDRLTLPYMGFFFKAGRRLGHWRLPPKLETDEDRFRLEFDSP